jgi:hypothetical protein
MVKFMSTQRITRRLPYLILELAKRNAHAAFLGQKTLPPTKKLLKLHIFLKEHHDIIPVDDEEIGCLPRVIASCASLLTPLIDRKTPLLPRSLQLFVTLHAAKTAHQIPRC